MRVIGGSAKGRPLKAPRGPGTRPTSDLVRGAIFDMLRSMGADLSRVLDLYAGTGALGIEALSRGAEWCDFVERGQRSCQVIRENLAHTGLALNAAVTRFPPGRPRTGCEGRIPWCWPTRPTTTSGLWRTWNAWRPLP